MSARKQYLLGQPGDLPLSIRALLDMLRLVREQTVKTVEGLTVAQLDHRHDAESNSIGMLLWHIAGVEAWYQVLSFDEREWGPDDAAEWDVALDMGEAARERTGYPAEHYVEILRRVRERTERELRARDEAWLLRVTPLDEDVESNNYWNWFHVCEDEIGHNGQIRWLKKRL
jgi:uncharacterized damage-inducible protein DinB